MRVIFVDPQAYSASSVLHRAGTSSTADPRPPSCLKAQAMAAAAVLSGALSALAFGATGPANNGRAAKPPQGWRHWNQVGQRPAPHALRVCCCLPVVLSLRWTRHLPRRGAAFRPPFAVTCSN